MTLTPDGPLPQEWLSLLREAGLPASVVAAVALAMTIWQFYKGIEATADRAEMTVLQSFARSPRVVRAAAMVSAASAATTAATVTLVVRVMEDPEIVRWLSTEFNLTTSEILIRAQAALVAFNAFALWWAMHFTDGLPDTIALVTAMFGFAVIVGYGAYEAWGSWVDFGAWIAAAYLWYRALTWCSNSAGSLARAIQRG